MKQVALALDQLLNALLGGWADETLSARVWRNRNNSWYWAFWHKAIDAVFFWQDNHCELSFYSEAYRKQLPEAYQQYKHEAGA